MTYSTWCFVCEIRFDVSLWSYVRASQRKYFLWYKINDHCTILSIFCPFISKSISQAGMGLWFQMFSRHWSTIIFTGWLYNHMICMCLVICNFVHNTPGFWLLLWAGEFQVVKFVRRRNLEPYRRIKALNIDGT